MSWAFTERCKIQCLAARVMGRTKPLGATFPTLQPHQAVIPAAHISLRQQLSPRFVTASLLHTACVHNEILTRQEKTVQSQWLHTCSKQKLHASEAAVWHTGIWSTAQPSSKQDKDRHHRCSKFVNSFSGPVKPLQTQMFKRNYKISISIPQAGIILSFLRVSFPGLSKGTSSCLTPVRV